MGKWIIETLNGTYECNTWERVAAWSYEAKDFRNSKYLERFILFQTEDGKWHLIENSEVDWIHVKGE